MVSFVYTQGSPIEFEVLGRSKMDKDLAVHPLPFYLVFFKNKIEK